MEKSIVLPAFFPETKNSVENIEGILELLSNYDVSIIEFYHNKKSKKINKLLTDKKLKSIFLGAIALKNKRLSLSSLDENLRRLSIEQMKICIDRAYYYNSNSLLINSGYLPKEKDNKQDACNILKESIFELMIYIKNSNFAYDLKLLLEPGVFGSFYYGKIL